MAKEIALGASIRRSLSLLLLLPLSMCQTANPKHSANDGIGKTAAKTAAGTNFNWTSIGIGSIGQHSAVAQNAQMILVGTDTGSMYRSLDQGQNWHQVGTSRDVNLPLAGEVLHEEGKNPGYMGMSAIAIDPSESNVVWAGGVTGLYKSEDWGVTWRYVPLVVEGEVCYGKIGSPYFKIAAIGVDPKDSDRVAVGYGTFKFQAASGAIGKIFLTEDGGESWSPMCPWTANGSCPVAYACKKYCACGEPNCDESACYDPSEYDAGAFQSRNWRTILFDPKSGSPSDLYVGGYGGLFLYEGGVWRDLLSEAGDTLPEVLATPMSNDEDSVYKSRVTNFALLAGTSTTKSDLIVSFVPDSTGGEDDECDADEASVDDCSINGGIYYYSAVDGEWTEINHGIVRDLWVLVRDGTAEQYRFVVEASKKRYVASFPTDRYAYVIGHHVAWRRTIDPHDLVDGGYQWHSIAEKPLTTQEETNDFDCAACLDGSSCVIGDSGGSGGSGASEEACECSTHNWLLPNSLDDTYFVEGRGRFWQPSIATDVSYRDGRDIIVTGGENVFISPNANDSDEEGVVWESLTQDFTFQIHITDNIAALWANACLTDMYRQIYDDPPRPKYLTTHWVKARGLQNVVAMDLKEDPHDENAIAISYTDNGLYLSKDGGQQWRWSYHGIPGRYPREQSRSVTFDPRNPGVIFSSGGGSSHHGKYVFLSMDDGYTHWAMLDPFLESYDEHGSGEGEVAYTTKDRKGIKLRRLLLDDTLVGTGEDRKVVLYIGTNVGVHRLRMCLDPGHNAVCGDLDHETVEFTDYGHCEIRTEQYQDNTYLLEWCDLSHGAIRARAYTGVGTVGDVTEFDHDGVVYNLHMRGVYDLMFDTHHQMYALVPLERETGYLKATESEVEYPEREGVVNHAFAGAYRYELLDEGGAIRPVWIRIGAELSADDLGCADADCEKEIFAGDSDNLQMGGAMSMSVCNDGSVDHTLIVAGEKNAKTKGWYSARWLWYSDGSDLTNPTEFTRLPLPGGADDDNANKRAQAAYFNPADDTCSTIYLLTWSTDVVNEPAGIYVYRKTDTTTPWSAVSSGGWQAIDEGIGISTAPGGETDSGNFYFSPTNPARVYLVHEYGVFVGTDPMFLSGS